MKLSYYEYVKEYIISNFSGYLKDLSESEYLDLMVSITNSVEKKYKNINELMANKADNFIMRKTINFLNDKSPSFKSNYVNLDNYVTKYIYGNYLLNCNDKTVDYISKRICGKLIAGFNYNSLNNGYYDNMIDNLYNDVLNSIKNYVIKYINLNIAPLTDINQVEVANEVMNMIVSSDSYNAYDLCNGKYSKLIEDKAISNGNKNRKKRIDSIHNYIKKFISDKMFQIDKIDEVVLKIYNNLDDKGIAFDLLSGKHDDEILDELRKYDYPVFKVNINEESIRDKSVKNEERVCKIKCVRHKRRINQTVVALILAGALIGGLSHCSNIERDKKYNNRGMSSVMEWDGYSYPNIRSKDDKSFDNTVGNVLESYDDYASFGNDNFKYLGFYRAYNSVTDNKLFIMDELIDDLKNDYSANGKALKEELKGTPNFISFMYKRICDMGYDKIKKSSVDKLLSSYANYTYKYPYSDVTKLLSDDDKEVLDKLFKVYDELSNEQLVKLGIFIDSNLDMENVSGRGH